MKPEDQKLLEQACVNKGCTNFAATGYIVCGHCLCGSVRPLPEHFAKRKLELEAEETK